MKAVPDDIYLDLDRSAPQDFRYSWLCGNGAEDPIRVTRLHTLRTANDRRLLDEPAEIIDSVPEGVDWVLLGERGSGHGRFGHWIETFQDSPHLVVRSEDARLRVTTGYRAWGSVNEKVDFPAGTEQAIRILVAESTEASDRVDALDALVKACFPNGGYIYLSLLSRRVPMALARHKAITSALRSWRDTNSSHPVRLIVSTTTVDAVMASNPNEVSSLIDGAGVYRLPLLAPEDLNTLLSAPSACPDDGEHEMTIWMEMESDVEAEAFRRVGGTPALVHVLRDIARSDPALRQRRQITARDMQRIWRQLIQRPPLVTDVWKRGLNHLLDIAGSSVTDALVRYVQGTTISPDEPPPLEDEGLYIGGWVARRLDKTWGIRSEFHERIAREVLIERAVRIDERKT